MVGGQRRQWFLNKQYVPQKRGYVVGQFAKFVRPGYYRVEATSRPTANVYVTAYKGDGKVAIVAINRRRSPVALELPCKTGKRRSSSPGLLMAKKDIAPGPTLTVAEGSFSAELPAQSVTTFVGELL